MLRDCLWHTSSIWGWATALVFCHQPKMAYSWRFGASIMTVCWKPFAGQRLYQASLNIMGTLESILGLNPSGEKRKNNIGSPWAQATCSWETGGHKVSVTPGLGDLTPNIFPREICLLDLPLGWPTWKLLANSILAEGKKGRRFRRLDLVMGKLWVLSETNKLHSLAKTRLLLDNLNFTSNMWKKWRW